MNYRDRVVEGSITVGLIDFVLNGVTYSSITWAVAGIVDGELVDYVIQNLDVLGEWEVGHGIYNAGPNSVTRGNITRSSNANALVNFSAGNKTVTLTLSERLMNKLSKLQGPSLLGAVTNPDEPEQINIGTGLELVGNTLQAKGGIANFPVGFTFEDAGGEDCNPVPGAKGDTGSIGLSVIGPAVFLEAEPGEDAIPLPGLKGDSGVQGIQGNDGPAVFLEAEPGEDAIPTPGLKGDQGIAGVGAIGPAVFLEAEPGEDTPILIPGPQGITGVAGVGSVGPAVFLEAEPGEDAIPVPGLKGDQGTGGTVGAVGPAVFIEAEPGEDAIPFPGLKGDIGPQGIQGVTGPAIAYVLEPLEMDESLLTQSFGDATTTQTSGQFVVIGASTDTTGSFTLPGWANYVEFEGVSAGGGGGAGRQGATTTPRFGGNGGNGGSYGRQTYLISDLGLASRVVFYTVGKFGAGANGQASTSTNGAAGGTSNALSVQKDNNAGATIFNLSSAIGGLGGTAAQAAQTASTPNRGLESGSAGSTSGTAGTPIIEALFTWQAATGGAAGASLDGSNNLNADTFSGVVVNVHVGTLAAITNQPHGGVGGTGGQTAGASGSGANNYGGGGGGGSASLNGTTSGGGGNGAPGILRIRFWV